MKALGWPWQFSWCTRESRTRRVGLSNLGARYNQPQQRFGMLARLWIGIRAPTKIVWSKRECHKDSDFEGLWQEEMCVQGNHWWMYTLIFSLGTNWVNTRMINVYQVTLGSLNITSIKISFKEGLMSLATFGYINRSKLWFIRRRCLSIKKEIVHKLFYIGQQ